MSYNTGSIFGRKIAVKQLIDFHDLLLVAKKLGMADAIITCYRGDDRLRTGTRPRPIGIAREAFLESLSGRNSLEHIFIKAAELCREIPFTCLIDETSGVIFETLIGITGSYGDCHWEEGPLLPKSLERAKKRGLKVMLGHTHPVGYGALCSNIYYKRTHRHGEDYREMRDWMRKNRRISRYHIIMSPLENQIGIFELESHGRIHYHPWEIIL